MKSLFEDVVARKPDVYKPGQLCTLQRRIGLWRASEDPTSPSDIVRARPILTDFTWCTSLGITINGAPFEHMLCHPVLPYSNWEWATVCHSESMAALRREVHAAVLRLGRVPEWHQTATRRRRRTSCCAPANMASTPSTWP